MLCSTCLKLATRYTTKTCVSCSGAVTMTISVLCDSCSDSNRKCSACLKQMLDVSRPKAGSCGTCGRK